MNSVMQGLATGNAIDLANPSDYSYSVQEIIVLLEKIKRFNGSGVSVASHSVMVANTLYDLTSNPHIALQGLFHDAAEAYIGDISSPVKTLAGAGLEKLEYSIHAAIIKQLAPQNDKCLAVQPLIHLVDQMVMKFELNDLIANNRYKYNDVWGFVDKVPTFNGVEYPLSGFTYTYDHYKGLALGKIDYEEVEYMSLFGKATCLCAKGKHRFNEVIYE